MVVNDLTSHKSRGKHGDQCLPLLLSEVFKIGIQGQSATQVAHTIVGEHPVLCVRGVW